MKGYVVNIEKETVENNNFRKVLYTGKNSQLVVMSLKPGQDIGKEIHQVDQFIRIEYGKGKAIVGGSTHEIQDNFAIIIPAGTTHNIVNGKDGEMKLYTIYSPPEHMDKIIHISKEEAMSDSHDHFDGVTSE